LKRINEYSYYEIDSKRGRDKTGEIRKQVRFFKEGSTFPNYQMTYGNVFKSGDINPSVEYGYAFPMRFNRKWENEM
jgi:CRISPR-associated protein Csm4